MPTAIDVSSIILSRSRLLSTVLAASWLAGADDSSAFGVEAFFAPPQSSGSIMLKLYPMENVSAGLSRRVTFGIPFPRESITVPGLATLRVLRNGTEVPAWVEPQTPWRHISNPNLDGTSVRVARIQIAHTFSTSYPGFESITVEWGMTRRAQNLEVFENPRQAWHLVTNGTFVAADQVHEPDVYVVLPKTLLCQGALKPTRMTPMDDGVGPTRENPATNDSIGSWPGYLEQDHASFNNFFSLINEDDARVTSANQCPYKTDSEPWLYDRASAMFLLYIRTGFLKPLREAVRATEFYKTQIYPAGTTPAQAVGAFKLKIPDPNDYIGGNGAMYSYDECLAYAHWLTGDDEVLAYIPWIVTAHEAHDEPTRWNPSLGEWTERHTAFRLLANVVAYEVLGAATYKSNVISQSSDFIWHQNGADGQLPANRVDGGLYHYGRQHGDGVDNNLVASSWMTVLTAEAMLRAYAFTEDPNIGNFIRRVGTFEKAACKTDSEHLYDIYNGPLLYPDYMMTFDGTSDPLDGRQDSMVEHSLEVANALAWAAYFAELAGTPDPSLKQSATNSYFTYDIGVNYWIRPPAPASGLTAYRVNPWRKYGWEHRPSGSLSWVLNQLTKPAPRLQLRRLPGLESQLTLLGEPGLNYTFEASLDLSDWTILTMISNRTGTVEFIDNQATNFPRRFYRARLAP